jgi:hypothetical protein
LKCAVPDFGGGEARRQLLDFGAGLPAADLAAEQLVEVQRLDGVVRADAVIGRAGTKPRARGGLIGGVTARQIRLLHKRVVFFLWNDVIGFGHIKELVKTTNIQHRTTNTEISAWRCDIWCSMFNVGRSMFISNQITFFTGTSGLTWAMGFSPFIARMRFFTAVVAWRTTLS